MRLKSSFFSLIAISILAIGCVKHISEPQKVTLGDSALPATPCTGILYGITGDPGSGTYLTASLLLNEVNKQTGKGTNSKNFDTGSYYANEATIMDSVYAITFPYNWSGGYASFTTLRYGNPRTGNFSDIIMPYCCHSLTSDNSKHLYYCVESKYLCPDTVISFQIVNGAITNRMVIGSIMNGSIIPATLTVDETNNILYLCFESTINKYETTIYQFKIGTINSPPVALNVFSGEFLIGLRYNPIDHFIYAIKQPSYLPSINTLIKINSLNGSFTKLLNLPESVNREFYSTALETCSNRLYISSREGFGGGFGGQLMTVDLQTAKTASFRLPNFYQGLAIQ